MAYDPWLDGSVTAEQNYADDTGLLSKIGYGATGAVVSGVQGMWNTFAALGNTFGADIKQYDTASWLKDNVSAEASRFYQDNQGVLDGIGFLATSLVPGGLAIKAAGAARVGKLINTLGWATGLENGVAAKYVAQAATIAREGSMTANLWAPKLKAVAGAVADTAIDGAVAGTVILATGNQNPSINKDQLDYFDSFKSNFNDFVNPFTSPVSTVLFGGFAGIAGLKAIGKVNAEIKTADIHRNALLTYTGTEGLNVNAGDGYLHLMQQAYNKTTQAAGLESTSRDFKDLTQTANTISTQARGVLMSIIPGQDSQLASMVNDVMIGSKNLEAQSNLMAGLNRIERVQRSLGPGQDEIASPILRVFDSEEYAAYSIKYKFDTVNNGIFAPAGLRETHLTEATSGPTIMLQNIDWFKKQGLNEDEAMLGTYLHELGHFRSWDLFTTGAESNGRVVAPIQNLHPGSIAQFVADSGDSPMAKKLGKFMTTFSGEMEKLSRIARPGHWEEYDKLATIVKAGNYTEAQAKAFLDATKYLYMSTELMADSFKVLTQQGINAKQFIRETPNVYNIFKRNGILFEQYARNKVGYDSWRGVVSDNIDAATSTMKITPQVGDIGGLQLINKNNNLTWGSGRATRTIDLNSPWNYKTLSPEDSDAMFAGQHMRWSDSKFASVNWDKATNLDNLPELQARYAKMKQMEVDGQPLQESRYAAIPVTDGKQEFLMDADTLAQHIQDSKSKIYQELGTNNISALPQDKINPQEFERLLNIDEYATTGNTQGDWMTYVSHDPTKPRHAILSYDARMDITVPEARSMLAVNQRIEQIRTQTQRIALNIQEGRWGEGMNLFGFAQHNASTETVNRASSQRGFFKTANGDYHTFNSLCQAVGKFVDKVSVKINDFVNQESSAAFYGVANKREALAEINTLIASKLRGSDGWATFDAGTDEGKQLYAILKEAGLSLKVRTGGDVASSKYLINADMLAEVQKISDRFKGDLADLPARLEGTIAKYANNSHILLQNDETFKALKYMQDANADMVSDKARLRAAAGRAINWPMDRIYIPPPNERQFTHVAFVKRSVPEGMGKADEHCLIFGQDAQDLANKINIIKQNFSDASVLTKDEMIAYKKANGDYNPSEMLSERSFNTQLQRMGLLNSPLPRSDTLELSAFTDYLKRQHVANTRDSVSLMFANEISELSHQAQLFDNVSASQTQGLSRIFRSRESSNPYQAAIDTMLNRNNGNKWSQWKTVAEAIDSGFSKVAGAVSAKFQRAVTDEDFAQINKYLVANGMQPAYKTALELQEVNRNVDRTLLSKTVTKANSILATGQLSLDFLESVVNAVSLPVMLVPELHNLKGSFNSPEFKALFSEVIPGTNTRLPSNTRAIANAIKDYVAAQFGTNTKIQDYMKLGILGREVDFIHQATRETMVPSEIFAKADSGAVGNALIDWNNRIGKAVEVAKKVTMAQASEQAVRFISANVAEQMAKAAGMTDKGQITALMNTFVNRVHGNYTAAQKPFMFQGVIGQAISLFQTYQFNLMQQAFRNVADGNTKSAAMMVALQGTLFGMRGLPAFNAINQRIGELHGNTGDDIISSTYANVGNNKLADWLVYGGASNLLGVDIFNRTDINPRHMTIVPTNFADIPAVSMSTKFFQNLAHTVESLNQAGLNGNTLLEGVAHNGLNRPLAGMAASFLGYRTTTKGGLLMAQKDEDAWASTAAAITGGKSIDEAIALDTLYRKVAYDAARNKDIQNLGSKYMGALRAGADIDHERMMQEYVKHGGTQETYNKWFLQLSKNANEGQMQKMVSAHNSQNGKFYQGIIGTDRSLSPIREPTMYSDTEEQQQSVSPDTIAQMPQP